MLFAALLAFRRYRFRTSRPMSRNRTETTESWEEKSDLSLHAIGVEMAVCLRARQKLYVLLLLFSMVTLLCYGDNRVL